MARNMRTGFRRTLILGIMSFISLVALFHLNWKPSFKEQVRDKQHDVTESLSWLSQHTRNISLPSTARSLLPPVLESTTIAVLQSDKRQEIPRDETVKSIIILAYQRTGSTFLGSLFNLDPRVFYAFEPLDALYSSLYGTQPGWNVPSDIVTTSSGDERPIPDADVTAVADFIINILSCNVDHLIVEFLLHRFWRDWREELPGTRNYLRCLERRRSIMLFLDVYVHGYCGKRFGEQPPERLSECRKLMSDKPHTETLANASLLAAFARHRNWMNIRNRPSISQSCSPVLKFACASRPLRVVKLVRASMRSMERILRELPDSHVIHLVRDPRAVTLSRRTTHESLRALYAGPRYPPKEQLVREASIYCRQVVDDVQMRRRLERQFPGRLYSLTYEELMENATMKGRAVYGFLGETPVTESLGKFASRSSGHKKKSGRRYVEKWRNGTITESEFNAINRDPHCIRMMALYPEYADITPVSFHHGASLMFYCLMWLLVLMLLALLLHGALIFIWITVRVVIQCIRLNISHNVDYQHVTCTSLQTRLYHGYFQLTKARHVNSLRAYSASREQ